MKIDKQKLFNIVFESSPELQMVKVVKIYIFLYKICGENGRELESWL